MPSRSHSTAFPKRLAQLEQLHRGEVFLFFHKGLGQNVAVDGSIVAGDVAGDQAGGFVDEIAFAFDVILPKGFRPEIPAVFNIQQLGVDPVFIAVNRRLQDEFRVQFFATVRVPAWWRPATPPFLSPPCNL